MLGQVFAYDIKDAAAAIVAWQTYLRRFPGGAYRREVTFRLGQRLVAKGSRAEGLRWIERYLARFPQGAHAPAAHLLAGQVKRELNRCNEALAHFRALGRADPRRPRALIGEAQCLARLGHANESRAYLSLEPRGRYAAEALAAQDAR